MNELKRILQAFEQSQRRGQQTALATVVQTSGSVYRRPGARMLLTEEGEIISAISGGCLEADVLARAQSSLEEETPPFVVRYDTTNTEEDLLFGFGLGCNGIVDVLIEPLHKKNGGSQLSFIRECLETQHSGVIATVFAVEGVSNLAVGDRAMMKSDGTVINQISDSDWGQTLIADTQKTLTKGKNHIQSYSLPQGEIRVLFEVIHPPLPLLVFGAGYDAVPVVQFAKQLGWQVMVIDHRGEYLTRDRFPQADQLLECKPDPADAYQHLLTPKAVAVVMTHRYVSDRAFLKHLIPSPIRYLGILGPKQRTAKLRQDLGQQKITATSEQQQRIYNPVGLDIAAETPEEIAISIIAEIQAVIGGGNGGFLRDRAGSIYTPIQHSWATSAL
ncbi:MAG: xanthine dehydrogenase [Cyanobacteria bacterium SW_9_44_58]|nr:MAG: xanthine dehydrogenase [Cyanobacteria bacterium SW_9_44_58]